MTLSALSEYIDSLPLIDHHAHGCRPRPVDRGGFENSLNEANVEPLAEGDSAFGTKLGFRGSRALRTTAGTAPSRRR
ncbi:MAG: hypothetical protein ACXWEI_02085 [Mycobacterium sp.]